MRNGKQQPIQGNIESRDIKYFFYGDIDAGKGMHRDGIDKSSCKISSQYNKSIWLFCIFSC